MAPDYKFGIRRLIAAKLVRSIRRAAAEGRTWPGVSAVYACGHVQTVTPAESWRRPVEINDFSCVFCDTIDESEPKAAQPVYEVRRPFLSPADPTRWQEANTVSSHRTLSGARRSLARQERGAVLQGGYSQDAIVAVGHDGTVTLVVANDD